MQPDRKFSWKARGRSFIYAFRGVALLLGSEHNAWIHTAAALCAVAAGCLLGISAVEWCVVVMAIAAVFAAEAFNSAIEALADRITGEQDPLIARAKDIAAAGVLITAAGALIAGLIIFIPAVLRNITY